MADDFTRLLDPAQATTDAEFEAAWGTVPPASIQEKAVGHPRKEDKNSRVGIITERSSVSNQRKTRIATNSATASSTPPGPAPEAAISTEEEETDRTVRQPLRPQRRRDRSDRRSDHRSTVSRARKSSARGNPGGRAQHTSVILRHDGHQKVQGPHRRTEVPTAL